jgi:hypothetical protein
LGCWARRDAQQRVMAIVARPSPVWARRRRRGGSAHQAVCVLSLWEEVSERARKGVRLGALTRRVHDTGSGLAPAEEG